MYLSYVKFLRFVCKNLSTFNRIRYILNPKEKSRLPKISKIDSVSPLKFDLYESNIDPYLATGMIFKTTCLPDESLIEM